MYMYPSLPPSLPSSPLAPGAGRKRFAGSKSLQKKQPWGRSRSLHKKKDKIPGQGAKKKRKKPGAESRSPRDTPQQSATLSQASAGPPWFSLGLVWFVLVWDTPQQSATPQPASAGPPWFSLGLVWFVLVWDTPQQSATPQPASAGPPWFSLGLVWFCLGLHHQLQQAQQVQGSGLRFSGLGF
jgi:hypothetical protein